MNLPNALTVGRIAITPLIAALPFAPATTPRVIAFVLFLVAAASDYADGVLARSRKQETTLGKLLDPLADKLLLVGTFIPMWALMQSPGGGFAASSFGLGDLSLHVLPFVTPWGDITLPWWIVLIVLGRELAMTIFRQAAARRGVVIAAIGPAKLKTTFQLLWQGAAYLWFVVATAALRHDWQSTGWRGLALFVGTAGTVMMTIAVVLTVYSLWLYFSRYGRVFVQSGARG
jgi:CDP-diacylglycerol---glycerol-3-phosphate 3-phosphatidyltransferase